MSIVAMAAGGKGTSASKCSERSTELYIILFEFVRIVGGGGKRLQP